MVTLKGVQPPIVIDQTSLTRYTALGDTADGFTITPAEGDSHIQSISFPGVTPVPAVIFYRTRHTGLPRFSVRINSMPLTQYAFSSNDPPDRSWHEIIPGTDGNQPILQADGNELIFAVYSDNPSDSDAAITISDIVIMYTSNEVTVKVPITFVGALPRH